MTSHSCPRRGRAARGNRVWAALLAALLASCSDDDGTPTDPPPGPAGPAGLIAFTMQCVQVGLGDLYVMEPDGENLRQLTTDLLVEDIAWFHGGQEIAFLRNVGTWEFDVFAIKPDGTGERRLTTGINAHYLTLSASPDGEWLLVREEAFPVRRLYRVAADGSGVDTLASNVYDLSDHAGASPWLPNGSAVVFQRAEANGQSTAELWTVDATTNAQHLLLQNAWDGAFVGGVLVFARNNDAQRWAANDDGSGAVSCFVAGDYVTAAGVAVYIDGPTGHALHTVHLPGCEDEIGGAVDGLGGGDSSVAAMSPDGKYAFVILHGQDGVGEVAMVEVATGARVPWKVMPPLCQVHQAEWWTDAL